LSGASFIILHVSYKEAKLLDENDASITQIFFIILDWIFSSILETSVHNRFSVSTPSLLITNGDTLTAPD